MKSLALIFSGLLLATTALAQHTGGGHSGGGHSGGAHFGGYHGGVYRGYGGAVATPYAAPAFGYGSGYYAPPAYSYGYTDPGYGYGYGYAPPAPEAPPSPGQIIDIPQGDGGQPLPPPPAPDDSQQANGMVVYQAPAPTQTPQEAAMSEGRYYLIAYKDHSVYTALAFWMENGTLNYVTPQNAHNQVSLDRLDLDLTRTLNARRGLPFNLVTQNP